MPPRPRRISALLFLALLSLIAASCGKERPVAGGATGTGPVIIISIDTLRADHLPLYGAKGLETPHIDALAKDSMVFENAYSHVPLTFPSHVTLLSGLLPAEAGVRNNLGYRFDSAAHPTIPTLLKAKGYATGAAVSAYVLRGATGLSAAFDDYDDQMDRSADHTTAAMGDVQRSGKETVASALRWIQGRGEQPFFYLLHLFEPHAPYAPPEPFRSRYAANPYDGEIAAADAYVGELLAGLKSSGVYDRATIILVSDHGEGLGDHGAPYHSTDLYNSQIQVPFVITGPGIKASNRVAETVSLTDLTPTLVELAGFQPPTGELDGRSVADLATGARVGSPDQGVAFAAMIKDRSNPGGVTAVVRGAYKLIDNSVSYELYDVKSDPSESQNLYAQKPNLAAELKKLLAERAKARDVFK